MAGFEPAFSSTPSWRIATLSHILRRAVPAAGVEPAASAFSARRSHHLSYTGINQRRRQESNLLRCRVAADRLAVRPRRHTERRKEEECSSCLFTSFIPHPSSLPRSRRWDSNPLGPLYEGGARPVEHRRPGRSQCWCRASSTEVQSLRPLPRAWPTIGCAGVEPAQPGFVDPALESARQPAVPHARVERANQPSEGQCLNPQDRVAFRTRVFGGELNPPPRPSQGRMLADYTTNTISLGAVTREGLEPSRHGGHGLLRTACLPVPPPGQMRVDRGGNRTLIGWLQASCLPVRRHAQKQTSGPGGGRTHSPLFKRQVLRPLSYKAS